MNKPVLFSSEKDLYRAENLKTVYDAFDGAKIFIKGAVHNSIAENYDLMVTDTLPSHAPKKCICINHGISGAKKIGFDEEGTNYTNPDLLTYIITTSTDMIPIVVRQTRLPESKVIPTGLPRTDAFVNVPHETTKTHLYAPTFRYYEDWYPNFTKMAEFLPGGHRMIIKTHIFNGDLFRRTWNNLPVASCYEPTTPYLLTADTVVTDYSSIMFDAMVMRKPVILFAKDKDKYLSERGMYMDYPMMYSPYYCEDERMLGELIREAKWNDQLEELRNLYAGACDGHATDRVIDLIRSLL